MLLSRVALAIGFVAAVRGVGLAFHRSDASVLAASVEETDAGKNPIRRVVSLLQGLAKKVEAEGETEEALYSKFMCYCKTSGGDLAKSIAESTAKIPQVQSDIEASESELKQTQVELASHKEDRTAAQAAIDAATAQREGENKQFLETSGEFKSYIASLASAIPAIQKGMAGGFLQTSMGAHLKQAIASDASLSEYDRQLATAFLSSGARTSEEYVPQSGEIVGILEQIKEDFEKSLADVTSVEDEAVKVHEELLAAKSKQVQALSDAIEKKTKRVGELQVSIANMKGELTQEEAALIADQKFAADLASGCETKTGEYEARKKMRAEELVAIHETIKILNDDDALDVFKKALPSPSLIQVEAGRDKLRAKAVGVVRGAARKQTILGDKLGLDFIAVALSGKQVDFSKVVSMIDDMVALLAQEELDDEHKKEYCEKQIDFAEDQAKELEKKVEDLDASVADKEELIAALVAEIKELTEGVAALDKSVAEATEQRKKEHDEYQELMKLNLSAKELLAYAKNRLNKFYNPDLYEAPKEEALVETAPVLMQVVLRSHSSRDEPPTAPETWSGAYATKSAETTGVIGYLDVLIKDLDKEMTVAETDEKAAQKEYEGALDDAAKKRAADNKSIASKEKSKADLEVDKANDEAASKTEGKELQATKIYEMQMHQECDWLLQNMDLRKAARADEVESLKQAKAILKGADFNLLQRNKAAASDEGRNLRGHLAP